MKNLLVVLLGAFLLVGFMSCDNETTATPGFEVDFDLVTGEAGHEFVFQVNFLKELSGDWDDKSAEIIQGSGIADIVAAGVGYKYQSAASVSMEASTLATDEFFVGGNSYTFDHDGGNDWGGVFGEFAPTDLTQLPLGNVIIAVKGGFPTDLTVLALQCGDGTNSLDKNIIENTPVTIDGWDVYTIPFSYWDTVDFSTFNFIGFFNPKTGDVELTTEGGYTATNFTYEIAFE